MKSVGPIFKTEMLIYQSKAILDKKFCSVNPPSFRPRNSESAGKGYVWEKGIHFPFCSIVYLLLKLKFCF